MLVVHVIDHHHRRTGARREALLLAFEKDAPIRRTLAAADAELALDMGLDVLPPARHSQVWPPLVHGLWTQKAVILLLRRAQRRQHRRALPPRRKFRHPMIDFL